MFLLNYYNDMNYFASNCLAIGPSDAERSQFLESSCPIILRMLFVRSKVRSLGITMEAIRAGSLA